ncbi:hypothetical protein O1611_g8146 [Lasiodiplodia mahajangana]|uniref:Uncharacterized protein n=1 Tax=Lasiodiplodia mahajangana TaxID=1108764 RepID=A0ACC2JD92_9PEZI|nr:hypothetical protein O1611_g8146 [Lasiodiplodia mahajangana]
MDVLMILDDSKEVDYWLKLLGQGEAFPRYKSWRTASVDDEGKLVMEDDEDQVFDTVLFMRENITEATAGRVLHTLARRLSGNGIIITKHSDTTLRVLEQAGLSTTSVGNGVLVAVRSPLSLSLEYKDVILLCRKEMSPSTIEIMTSLKEYLRDVARASKVRSLVFTDISEHDIAEDAVYISLLEVECELLATITRSDLGCLQTVTNTAKHLLWLTGADVLHEPNPDLTLSNGLSRALMLEQPSLHFSVLDIGSPARSCRDNRLTCESVLSVLSSCFRREDTEFVLADGLVWVSRLYEDSEFNAMFRRQLGTENPAQLAPLAAASPARLAIEKVGVTDTLHFQMEMASDPPSGFVDIETKAFGLNAKDVYAMAGRVETRDATNSLEFSGTIKAVGFGADNDRLKPGDRVVVMAPNHSSTVNRVPAWSVHKMRPDEDFVTVATLPVAYSTALYALCDRANLRAGESVLIHSGAGGLGIAAIRVAQRIGAVVFTTVSTASKRAFLERELGLPSSHIFHSRDEGFVEDVKRMTGGHGVNVVLNSLTGDLLHASWRCISHFGRFVEVGKRDLIDAGRLDMHMFLQSSTFTAFDLSEMFYHEDTFYRDLLASKVNEVLTLFRSGEIKALPVTTFDVGDIPQAYRHFSSREHIGKIAVSLENPGSHIMVSPPKYWTHLAPDKSFLMIGCLGGLGRSLTRWMVARGARKFIFLSRSGAVRSEAQSLIRQLESNDVTVAIIKGNVAKPSDVTAAIAACEAGGTVLGGVVQGAMALHEALFTNMTSEAWHTTLEPKWKGTWCLHKCLEGHDQALDFFLLMSSVNGTISWATESNYSAANVFLNTFSSWSRKQGLPTVALGLGMVSEVGYIHENAHIESLLLRRGLVPFNEKEFLQIVDLALTRVRRKGSNKKTSDREDPGESNIVTGLELEGTFRLIDQGFEVTPAFGEDLRASLLLSAFEAEQRARLEEAREHLAEKQRYVTEAPWWGDVPDSATEILKSQSDAPTLRDAVLRVLRKQFSTLMLMPLENVNDHKSMMEVGVDSMIASEFRAWLWKCFRIDVTLLDLLGPRFSLEADGELAGSVILGGCWSTRSLAIYIGNSEDELGIHSYAKWKAIPLNARRVFRAIFISPRDVASDGSLARIERLYNLTGGQDAGVIFLLSHDDDDDGQSAVSTLMALQLQLIGKWELPIIPVDSVAAVPASLLTLRRELIAAHASPKTPNPAISLLPFCSDRGRLAEHSVNILTDTTSGFKDLLGKLSSDSQFASEITGLLGEDAEKLKGFWKEDYLVD